MWNITQRIGLLIIIGLWQIIQFIVFMRRVLFKNDARMFAIALYYDLLANVTLNGREGESISSRTGRGLIARQRWAIILGPLIDSIFGQGHCIKQANEYLIATHKAA